MSLAFCKCTVVSECLLVTLFYFAPLAPACTQPPGYGFSIQSTENVYENGELIFNGYSSFESFYARWKSDLPNAAGSYYNGNEQANGFGVAVYNGFRTPAVYTVQNDSTNNSYCRGYFLVDPTTDSTSITFQPSAHPKDISCDVFIYDPPTISPTSIVGGQEVFVSISDPNISTAYGDPRVDVNDYDGTRLVSEQIGPNSQGQYQVLVDAPERSTVTRGSVMVSNRNADGSFTLVAGAVLTFKPDPQCVNGVCP